MLSPDGVNVELITDKCGQRIYEEEYIEDEGF